MTTPEVQVSWQDYVVVALRRKWFFVVPVILTLISGLIYALFAPRIYEAQALIVIQSEKLINPLIQGLAVPTAISDRLHTLREEILSFTNLSRLITTHGLDRTIPSNNPVAFERLVVELRDDIKVRMKGDSLIQVSYEGRDPIKVQELVNSLTDIVIERNTAIQEQETTTAVSFIEEELNVYRKKLEESEQKLREFKELYMTQMPIATALNGQLKDLELQLSTLLIDNMPEHPRVIEVKRQIEEVRNQRDEEIRRLVARGVLADKDPALYEELLNQMDAVKNSGKADAAAKRVQEAYNALVQGLESPEVQRTGSQIAVNSEGTMIQLSDAAANSLTLAPRQQQELVRLTRDYSVNEQIYRGLLEKLERAKITGRLGEDDQGGKFVVIERARYPLRPIKPQLVQVFLMALLGGIGLGVGAVILSEYLDQSIQNAEEVAELLEVPVLGSISTIVTASDLEHRRRRRKDMVSFKDHYGRFKTKVAHPIWSRLDQVLVRWGL